MLAAGLPINESLAEADLVDQAKAVIEAMKARGAEVPIPTDVVVAKTFAADAPATVKAARDVVADDMILDIGPQTAQKLAQQLKAAGTIVWNGPVGVFRVDCRQGTEAIACAIAESQLQHRRRRRHAGRDRQVRHRGQGGATSPPAAAPSWRCWKARPCRRSKSCRSAQRQRTGQAAALGAGLIGLQIFTDCG